MRQIRAYGEVSSTEDTETDILLGWIIPALAHG